MAGQHEERLDSKNEWLDSDVERLKAKEAEQRAGAESREWLDSMLERLE